MTFKTWFKEQFGGVPSERRRVAAREEIKDLKRALSIAEFNYKVEDELFTKWTAALYGWNARKK